jgi:ABC-type tungstate transport system substrate-binding protein
MKKETNFLRLAVFFIGFPILILCIFLFPIISKEAAESSAKMAYILYTILLVMYITAIPFYTALYQAFKLLNYIDENKAFSDLSVKALSKIKKCATIICLLYLLILPLFYIIGEVDDAPGVIIIGMIFVFAPMVVAVFAAVLQKLLKNAVDIKNDNDLTI